MNNRNNKLTCSQAKEIDMVLYLSKLGYEPVQIRNGDYWYISPLRKEKTASFKVNRTINRWYDHGLGKGGNLIDFAILYNDCTIKEFLQTLSIDSSFHKATPERFDKVDREDRSEIKVLEIKELRNAILLHYLEHRRVPREIAKQFCKEVYYEIAGKKYYAIGFTNNSGGFELRNPYFKGSCTPKDITTVIHHTKEMTVFEGFFDFLSFIALLSPEDRLSTDFTILNSISFFQKARPLIEQYEVVNLYLDNDLTGQNCSLRALAMYKGYRDKSSLYKQYKDVNEWAMHVGKSAKGGNLK